MTLYVGDQLITPTIPGSGGGSPVQKYGLSIDSFIGDVSNGTLNAPVMETSNIVFNGVTDLGDNALKYAFNGKNLSTVSFPQLVSISGTSALHYTFNQCLLSSVSFPVLTSVTGAGIFQSTFQQTYNLYNVIFPELVIVSGNNAFQNTFSSGQLRSASFPKLETIIGENCFNNTFSYNGNLVEVDFSSLTTIDGFNAMTSAFSGCSSLERIDFPSLTTIDINDNVFGDQEWNYIFSYCDNLTEIHFRADMSNVIPNIVGYNDKWGANNATIYFDLAACEVTFNVTPSENTNIYFDRRLLTSTTIETGTGDHKYTIINQNYPIYDGNITNMQVGDTLTITKDLTQINGHNITINTNVENCTVEFNYNGYSENATTVSSTSYESKEIYTESSMVVGYTVSKEDYSTVSGSITISDQDVSINVTLRTNEVDLSNYLYTLDGDNNAILTDYIGPDVSTLVLPNI